MPLFEKRRGRREKERKRGGDIEREEGKERDREGVGEEEQQRGEKREKTKVRTLLAKPLATPHPKAHTPWMRSSTGQLSDLFSQHGYRRRGGKFIRSSYVQCAVY